MAEVRGWVNIRPVRGTIRLRWCAAPSIGQASAKKGNNGRYPALTQPAPASRTWKPHSTQQRGACHASGTERPTRVIASSEIREATKAKRPVPPHPKGRMSPDGTRRYIVPATPKIVLAKPYRYRKKTVIIEAAITADKNPGGPSMNVTSLSGCMSQGWHEMSAHYCYLAATNG